MIQRSRLALVKCLVGEARGARRFRGVADAVEVLDERQRAHAERVGDREPLAIERVDQPADRRADAVIVVVVVAAGRFHAADIAQDRRRMMDGVGVGKHRLQQVGAGRNRRINRA